MSDEPTFERWRRQGQTFSYRGNRIFFHVEGDGPVLLTLHGFPSASWDWHRVWPALTARFRVVAADMIGFGWSAKPRRYEYSILDQATLQESLLRSLGATRVHILAHDYGVTVAQELLARDEERGARGDAALVLESMCFLNGGLFPEAHRPRVVQTILASPLGPLVGLFTSKRAFASGLEAVFGAATPPGPALIDELWTMLRHDDGHRVLHRIIGYMAERRTHRERWVGTLRRARIPLRLIDGMADPVSGAHMVARYRDLVPGADVVELPAIGHYPQLEDPDGVARGFLAFHDSNVRASGRA